MQVSASATFDDEPILFESFAESPAREQWTTTASFASNSTAGNCVSFTKKNQYLVSPIVTNLAVLTWCHSTTANTNAWRYRVECSPDSSFNTVSWTRDYAVAAPQTTPVPMSANLQGQGIVYIRWVDARENSSSAQRYISAVSLTGALTVNANGLTSTSRAVGGCAAETTYYVRVKAWGEGGWSGWSAVKSVTTAGAAAEIDPDNPPANPNLQMPVQWNLSASAVAGGQVQLEWDAVQGALGYNLEATTNLLDPSSWHRIGTDTNGACSTNILPAADGVGIFYRLRAW